MSRDLDSLAQEAVTHFIRKSVPLNDSIKKIAERHDLNAEEVKRVVGKANTSTMLHLLATSDNKKQEFELANYSLPEQTVEEPVTDTTEHFPDFRTRYEVDFDLADPTQEEEKTASEYIGLKDYFKWKIEKEQIGHTKVATEMKVYDTVDYLVSEFSRYNAPDFQKFANEAYTMYGPAAEPLLNSIANGLREQIDLSKCAYVIDDRPKYFDKFAGLISDLKTLVTLNSKETVLNNSISRFTNAYL